MKLGVQILFVLVILLIVDYLFAQSNKPKIIIRDALPYHYNAQTIPPYGIFVKREHQDNEMLLAHEMVHWQQYQRSGAILFYLKYLAQKSFYGYDKMPMEIEPRLGTNENTECLNNYTECVRSGKSAVVLDKEFRKPKNA